MATNEEQLRKYYNAAQGNNLRQIDSAFGVTPNGAGGSSSNGQWTAYDGNKMIRNNPNSNSFTTLPANQGKPVATGAGAPDNAAYRPYGGNAPAQGNVQTLQIYPDQMGSGTSAATPSTQSWTPYDGNKMYQGGQGTNSAQGGFDSAFGVGPSGSSGTKYPDSSLDSDMNYNGNKRFWLDKMYHGGEENKKGTDSGFDSGFGYPGNWTKPARPGNNGQWGGDTIDPGFSYPTWPGSGNNNIPTLPSNPTGKPTEGDTTGGSTGTGSTGTGSGTSGSTTPVRRTLMEMYDDYLNQLGGYTTPSAKDQSDLVREMYEANLAANKSQLESDYNQNLSDLESEASKIGSTYYEQQRQAQAESDRNRQSFQEYANARGLNSGTGGQAELARQNQLSANLNTLRQSEAEKRAEVERQRVLLGQQYQNAIQKAQADNDLAKAKALYEEAVRVDESLASAAKADADRALQIFNILNNTALSAANAYASQESPDLSLYGKLLGISGLGGGISGSSTEELENMYNKAQQIRSSGGYYVSNGSGGTTFKKATSGDIEWAEYYIDIINAAGGINNVQDYLAMNYKSYGIPYQTVSRTTASMAEKAKGYSTNKYTIGSEKGKDIANSLGVGNTYQASDGSVWRKSSNGKIYVTKDGVEMEAQIK
nr:MAG TPA: hypothetical protein [Bacteriophage sp.]